MKELRWQNFLPVPPVSEKAFVTAGLHFSRICLENASYGGSIEDGYLVSISTGPPCMLARQIEHGFDIGQLATGTIMVTPPSSKVEWQITGEGEFTSIYLSHRYIEHVAASIALKAPAIKPMFQHKDKLMEGIFGALEEQLEAEGYHDHLYMEAMARALCIHLLHKNVEEDARRLVSRQRTLSFEQIEKIRACVMERLEERILTEELAKCVHISDYHFYRIFKRTTGITPQHFIKKCRLERAKLLVEQTNMALIEIACKTGFTDQSHLAREFRSGFGMSPRQLRTQMDYDRNMSLAF